MGYWSGLAAFDYNVFDKVIVPAMLQGEYNPIVQDTFRMLQRAGKTKVKTLEGLEETLRYFSPDLMETSLARDEIIRYSKLESEQNVLVKPEVLWTFEDISLLFEMLITRYCIRYFTHFGLSLPFFNAFVQSDSPETQQVISELGRNAFLWRHNDGGFGEGIHGIISAKQAQLLSGHLQMNSTWAEDDHAAHFAARFEQVQSFIEMAASKKLGLIWGRDLNIFYSVNWQNSRLGTPVFLDFEKQFRDKGGFWF